MFRFTSHPHTYITCSVVHGTIVIEQRCVHMPNINNDPNSRAQHTYTHTHARVERTSKFAVHIAHGVPIHQLYAYKSSSKRANTYGENVQRPREWKSGREREREEKVIPFLGGCSSDRQCRTERTTTCTDSIHRKRFMICTLAETKVRHTTFTQ